MVSSKVLERQPAADRSVVARSSALRIAAINPASDDQRDDPVAIISERRLVRLVTLAAQTATRFARQSIPHDPVSWMLAPRTLFRGARPIDAAQEREPFLTGMVFHAVSTALDGDPEVYSDLAGGEIVRFAAADREGATGACSSPGLRLHTCYVDLHDGSLQALWAMMARDEAEARGRALDHFGEDAWDAIEVTVGYEPTHPVAVALVTEVVEEMLCRAMLDPDRAASARFEVFLDLCCAA